MQNVIFLTGLWIADFVVFLDLESVMIAAGI